MHRLVHLIITQPDLLFEHASAYAELAGADAQTVSNAVQTRILRTAVLLCCVSVASILAGVSLLIWAAVPESAIRLPWVLLVVPLVPAAAALICLISLKFEVQTPTFARVRQQIAADIQMLREVSAS
jgi:hypothetical protein